MRTILIAILIVFGFQAKAVDSFYGFTGGLSFALGTKMNRIGVSFSGYYNYGFVQVNAQISGFYNFQTLGTKYKSPELQMGIGGEFGWGKKDSVRNEFVGLAENNMQFPYSVGYSFIHYFDKINTSQSSGILNFNIKNFRVLTENDLFGAGQGWRDRYRTGAFLIEYQYENFRFATNLILWTGDYSRSTWVKDGDYPGRFGYLAEDKTILPHISAGLFGLQVRYLFPYYQIGQVNLGVDSEHMRDLFQNKFIHDQPFFKPDWVKRKPPHIPMLDTHDEQYLYRADQKVRPASLYFELCGNSTVFY